MPRAPKQEILYQEQLNVPEFFLRWATPAEVALYRADRLKCNTIAEIGAGIGGQTIAFAKECKKVIAVEIDKKQTDILKDNLKRLNITNVTVISEDGLSNFVVNMIKSEKPDIIFCDTARKTEGERSIDDLRPNIEKVIEKYSDITDKIAIEVPPFTKDLDRLKGNYEKEFLSLYGKLNRLTLYFNKLRKTGRAAVSLPEGTRIEDRDVPKIETSESAVPFSYLYTIDPAVVLSGLIDELAAHFKANLIEMNKKSYFLSKERIKSDFLQGYKILDICDNNFNTILNSLIKLDAGKVVIRYNILPEDYWKERNKYENRLSGEREVHVFANKEAILCTSMN